MSTRSLVATVLALAAVGAAVYPLLTRRGPIAAAQPTTAEAPAVKTALVEARPMRRTIRLSGTLQSGSEANLSPKQGGKVLSVLVREGQLVRRGEVLVRLDRSDAARQAEQASAGAAAARATLEKARLGARLKRTEVDQRINEARRGVELAKLQLEKAQAGIRLQRKAGQADVQRAQAGVDAARSALAKAKAGARPEERKQVQLGVRQAERGVELARKNLDDTEYLFSKGGVPRIQVDQAREGHQKALDGLAQAKSQLDLVNAGATPEDLAAAEAQVRNAEAGLTAARTAANRDELDDVDTAAARSQVKQAEDGLRTAEASRSEIEVAESDVRAAEAAYLQAQAGSRLARQQLSSSDVIAPIDGTVTSVLTHVGEMAGPGMPLVTLTGTAGVYLEAAAPARTVQELRPGQPATVTLDSVAGRSFPGVVRSIGTVAGPDGRTFPVRIDLSAAPGVLKPGAAGRVEVVAASQSAVTVPITALRAESGHSTVWVVRNGHVAELPVELGLQDRSRAEVRGDLRAGEQVVLSSGPGVRPGDPVRTDANDGALTPVR
jgi:HlyD family secretion protein